MKINIMSLSKRERGGGGGGGGDEIIYIFCRIKDEDERRKIKLM